MNSSRYRTPMLVAMLVAVAAVAIILISAIGRGKQGTDALTEEQYVAQMEKKLAVLERDAASRPNDTDAANAVADMLFYLERFDAAEREYLRSLAIDREQPIIWSLVGETRVRQFPGQGISPAAQEAFQQALLRNPKDDRALFYMAIHAANIGQTALAMQVFRELSASAPPESISKTAAERAILELQGQR